MSIEHNISNLKKYIEEDEIYTRYKNGEYDSLSDFEMFCVNHCKDIEILLGNLEALADMQRTADKNNEIIKLQKENETLKTTINKQSSDISNNLLELQQKDKQIDLMAKKLNQAYFDEDKFCVWFEKMMGVQEKMDYGYVVDLIKQYFETKVKKGK